MTDLRQAAQQALEALREFGYHGSSPRWERTANALKAALAQPEQEPVAYDKTEINGFVQELYDKKMQEGKHGHYETVFHVVHQAIKRVSPPAAQRPWQSLTDDDWEHIDSKKDTALDSFAQGAVWAAYKLERRNT